MPLLLWPLLAGVGGFGAGFFASDGLDRLFKAGLIIGVGYVGYQVYQGNK